MLFLLGFSKLIWLFTLYSFLGWLMEVIFCSLRAKKFVNRGFLFGPFCPIYGFGMLLVVAFLTPLETNLFIFFISAILVTTLLEYLTGLVMDLLFHTQWWDYSNEKFNINGYVCLRYSIYWGILSVFVVKLIHPWIDNLANFLLFKFSVFSALMLVLYFLTDITFTIISLYGIKHVFELLNNLKIKYEKDIALLQKHHLISFLAFRSAYADFEKAQNQIIDHLKGHYIRIIRAFPDLRSSRYHIIDELKQKLKENRPFIK
jgi:uncharacterized membrane protein